MPNPLIDDLAACLRDLLVDHKAIKGSTSMFGGRFSEEKAEAALSRYDAEKICPNCGGEGYTVGVRPTCCGNTINGGCRGHCAVPEQYQEQCELCATQVKEMGE